MPQKVLSRKIKTLKKLFTNRQKGRQDQRDQAFWQLATEDELRDHVKRLHSVFFEKEYNEYIAPIANTDLAGLDFFRERFTKYLYQIHDCVVDPFSALPVVGNKYIFEKSHILMNDPWGKYLKRPSVKDYFDKKRNDRELNSAILVNFDWTNYYHFLIDTAPQLEMADQYGISSDVPLLVPSEYTLRSFVADYFKHIKPTGRPVIVLDGKTHYKVKKLYIAKDVYFSENTLVAKNHFKNFNGMECPEKIFVTRHLKNGRTLLNWEEIESLLKEQGFTTIEPGNYSITQQIELFSNAKCVVGVHGAGMTNIIFSRHQNVKVIEIFKGGNEAPDHYAVLSKLLGFRYQPIHGGMPDKNNNFVLDPEVLRALL